MTSRMIDLKTTFRLVLVLAGFLLLAAVALQGPGALPPGSIATVEIRLQGSTHAVAPSRIPWLEQFSLAHFHDSDERIRSLAGERIDSNLDVLFDQAHARVPELADWYYSLGGEYTRMLLPLLIRTGVATPDYLAERTEKLLFGEALLSARLEQIRADVDGALGAAGTEARQEWLEHLERNLEPAPAGQTVALELDLDVLTGRLAGYDSPEFIARISASSVAGLGVAAGPLIWQAASRRAAASGRSAAARVAGRAGGRAGSAAAGGALACAPSGPVAVGCALLAGAGAWLATDWLLLRADEALNRDALEDALHANLQATREELQASLHAAYEGAAATRRNLLLADIRQTFVPAHRLTAAR